MHNLQSKKQAFEVEHAKPFTLHCSLLMLVLLYSFLGGFVFDRIETDAHAEMKRNERTNRTSCVSQILHSVHRWSRNYTHQEQLAEQIADCFEPEKDERSEWNFVTATLYGFGIVTTLGYNRIAPITYTGRMFCIVYGICGIPVTMIIIANVGQYLNNFAGDSRRKIEAYRQQRRMSKASLAGKVYKESSIQVTSLALLCVFLAYVGVGALLLPLLNGELDFFNGLYFNFLCLTAIDFGQLVPIRVELLPITFLYVCIGLAITTIAISKRKFFKGDFLFFILDIGSEYMKKLHYWGKKMKNAAQTRIWFGGKTLKVRDLLHAVGKKCGVEPGMIDALDLENVVERTIAIQEGREPPEDLNDEPREPSPRSIIHSPCSTRPSNPPMSPPSPREDHPFIFKMDTPAPRSPLPLPSYELDIKKPIFQALSNEFMNQSAQEKLFDDLDTFHVELNTELVEDNKCESVIIIEPPATFEDMTVQSSLNVEDYEKEEKAPKRFREKKEMYGRDPRKLYETYQEEWDRLERLSDRKHGPRRKSVLNLATCSPERSVSPSPIRHSLTGEDNRRNS
ncbi:Protein CBR-TWK-16 [Caenorhabditis briggsae]|uniref:Protein CBR-TWK-16 n=2 Tax=Caenorhabditis briggsae TaxID=6238 RepID=A8XJD2_CAEBR|nr:Protein CBR-TWK-16 [Caenorhabditis briggsae]CAP32757.2 Protein CBR-TWK-16 [Caenorhabditis briggsae]